MSAHTYYRSNLPATAIPKIPRNLRKAYERLALINCYLGDAVNSRDYRALHRAISAYLLLPESVRDAAESYESEHMLLP